MSEIAQVLKRPIVTERSTRLRELNQYVFEVDPRANKYQIRDAVEGQYKVDVKAVRTIKRHGKFRRRSGPVGGYKSDTKRAIVSLKEGQKISLEEAV